MRVAVLGFMHETNTFAPTATKFDDFSDNSPTGRLYVGDELMNLKDSSYAIGGAIQSLICNNVKIVPIAWCEAEPGGVVCDDALEQVMDVIIDGLRGSPTVDAVFADLHGAMVTSTYLDADLEIIRRIRRVVGPETPIVCSLDLHGNISPDFVQICDGLSGYRTYPHVDMRETGVRCIQQIMEMVKRPSDTRIGVFESLDFFIPMHQQTTLSSPADKIFEKLEEIERAYENEVDLSFMCGFYASDTYWAGPSIISYSNNAEIARRAKNELSQYVKGIRNEFRGDTVSISQAVKLAVDHNKTKPILLAEVQDNPGGGGTGDVASLIEALCNSHASSVSVSAIFDPKCVSKAHQIGAGASAHFSLGGKTGYGSPYDAEFKVAFLGPGKFAGTGPMSSGVEFDIGPVAVLEKNGVEIVVSSVRIQNLDVGFFRVAGINPSERQVLVIKSTVHYRAAYEGLVDSFLSVATPGCIPMDPSKLSFKNLRSGVARTPRICDST